MRHDPILVASAIPFVRLAKPPRLGRIIRFCGAEGQRSAEERNRADHPYPKASATGSHTFIEGSLLVRLSEVFQQVLYVVRWQYLQAGRHNRKLRRIQ